MPLMLHPNNSLIEPSLKDGTFVFKSNEVISLNCPGEHLKINNVNTKMSQLNATCSGGVKFNVQTINDAVAFDSIQCTNFPHHVAKYTGKNCLNNSNFKEIEVGFNLTSVFLRSYLICFDGVNQNTLYSTFNMSYMIKGNQVSVPRIEFIQGQFFDVGNTNVNSLYVRGLQRRNINKQLGMTSNNYTYVSKSDDFYLSRGHLTAKADFVYGSQQQSTFYYVNAAPQWQTFNEGNWNELEQSVRYFVGRGSKDITVYTGSYGITTLPHAVSGKATELYLYLDNKRNGIAVPEVYWKIIYEPNQQLGTAFVGVNNPYQAKHTKICNDVCNELEWIRWDQNNVTAGISYCCTIDDLRKTVKTIPPLRVKGLLK